MNIPINFDIEHNQILEQLPMYAMLAFFIVMALPIIPQQLKSTIMLVGLLAIFVFMFTVGPIAQYIASQYIVLKVRIRPYNAEKTFFCRKPAGTISSTSNKNGIYTTPFQLGIKTSIPVFGQLDGLLLEHLRPFEERNVGTEIYVMFMGQEVKVARGILADFWISEENPIMINDGGRILRAELAVGGEDFELVHNNRNDGYCGRFDYDVKKYNLPEEKYQRRLMERELWVKRHK